MGRGHRGKTSARAEENLFMSQYLDVLPAALNRLAARHGALV